MHKQFKKVFAPFASLKLTVVLLGLSIFLVFAGTLAQTERGLWEVMHDYFRSFYVFIPLRIFVPQSYESLKNIPLALPFPGGYTIGSLMLLNLFAAHSIRFKVKARGPRLITGIILLPIGTAIIIWFHNSQVPANILARSGGYAGILPLMGVGAVLYSPLVLGCMLAFSRRGGIVIAHAALILLLLGEAVTAGTAVETQMPIYEGTTTHWAQNAREIEFSVVDPSATDTDFTVAIPGSVMAKHAASGEPIIHPDLPFSITVDRYFFNSTLHRADDASQQSATMRGIGIDTLALNAPKVSGEDAMQDVNVPAAYVTLSAAGSNLGTYLVSPNLGIDQYVIAEQDVHLDSDPNGKVVRIALRFRRYYKPYAVHLDKFNHDVYPGTTIPKNFSSDIRLTDPAHNVDRNLVIHMNNPLRYAGDTFFQSGWIPGLQPGTPDRGTVLMVVRNPGWTIPYIACALGTIGLTIQFSFSLAGFLKRSKS